MKEFKASKKDENVKNDNSELLFGNNDSIDNKINEDLKEIKEKLNAEKLSDEFKANLTAKLIEELNKPEDSNKAKDSNKGKIIKFPSISRKLAGICACFIFLFLGCFAYADDIENVILNLFGNTDKIIANAIEDGNYKEINMDYVEDQGISIKVDYVVIEDNELYIAFNVLGDEYDKIFINDININANDKTFLYSSNCEIESTDLISCMNYIYDDNMIIIYKLTGTNVELKEDISNLKIKISKIKFMKNNIIENKNGNWNLEINI